MPSSTTGLCASGLLLATVACGRTPVIEPCTERLEQTAVLTCDPDAICEAPVFSISNRPANTLVVLDRSCSMATQVDGRSKWSRAVEAVTQVVHEPRANLRWGLSLFPRPGLSACEQGPIEVPVGVGNEVIIERRLQRALDRDDDYYPGEPCGTNLAGATRLVLDEAPFGGLDGRRTVVLITDGRHAGCPGSAEDAVRNVERLLDHDVQTAVVGFGGSENAQVLQALGEAGGVHTSTDEAYYLAGLDELGEVLQSVVLGLGCSHPLIIDAPLGDVQVDFDGSYPVPLDFGEGEGWRYEGETLIFSGEACQQLLRGEVESIDVSLRCGSRAPAVGGPHPGRP